MLTILTSVIQLSSVVRYCTVYLFLFFFNDTPTTEIYTLSLHDALPILPASPAATELSPPAGPFFRAAALPSTPSKPPSWRSEEHTSELQSHHDLVCRLLLEKKKNIIQVHAVMIIH